MPEPQEEDLRREDAAQGIAHRKRVPPPDNASGSDRAGDPQGVPDGMMWPSDGFEANQYSPAGEVVVFANLFQAIQRRWRRRR